MFIVDSFTQNLNQFRIIYRESPTIRSLHVHHHLVGTGRDWIYQWGQGLRFDLINRPCGLVRITETGAISQHLALFASGEKWKSFWTGRTGESKQAIAVNAAVTGE